jgi:arylsulfatase
MKTKRTQNLLAIVFVGVALITSTAAQAADKPNIVFILTDNLGYGEIGSYGGGIARGAPTPRIDSLATEGARFLNMNMETQCTPSRSSLMTGRFSIRSGTYAVPFGGVPEGLTQWEITIAESLSVAGYATALHGKWHLGSHDGRLPNDQGFDEWYGIPRTTDEALWSSSANYSTNIVPQEQIMEGRKGEKSHNLKDYDIVQRRLLDAEITRRSVAFIERQAKADKPFFMYVCLTQPHLPSEPNPSFKGKTGNGDWADMWKSARRVTAVGKSRTTRAATRAIPAFMTKSTPAAVNSA